MLCLRRPKMSHDRPLPFSPDAEIAWKNIQTVWQQRAELDPDDLDDAVLAFSAQLIMHDRFKYGISAIQYYCGLTRYHQKTKT